MADERRKPPLQAQRSLAVLAGTVVLQLVHDSYTPTPHWFLRVFLVFSVLVAANIVYDTTFNRSWKVKLGGTALAAAFLAVCWIARGSTWLLVAAAIWIVALAPWMVLRAWRRTKRAASR